MPIKPTDPAFPCTSSSQIKEATFTEEHLGINIRTHIATTIMEGLAPLMNATTENKKTVLAPAHAARLAVKAADALIAELNRVD